MLTQHSVPYVQALISLPHGMEKNSCIAAAAVAMVASSCADVPSTPVASPTSHYAGTHAMTVRNCVGQFNEAAPLDCGFAIALAQKFWMIRYNAVHPAPNLFSNWGCFFEVISSATLFFSEDEVKFLNDYAKDIFAMMNIVKQVCDAMKVSA